MARSGRPALTPRAGARAPVGPRTLVLDSEGLSKAAAGEMRVRAYLAEAHRNGADVVVSALTLTETLRGVARDASVHRVVAGVEIVEVSRDIAAAAGALLGQTHRDDTVDAVVAVTADRCAHPVQILTSDPSDLSALVAAMTRMSVVAV